MTQNKSVLHAKERSLDTSALARTVRTIRLCLCLRVRIDRGEILERARGVRLHRLLALVPVRGAHLAVFVRELERLEQTERLVDGAPHREVVDRDLAEGAFGVDEEEPAEGDAFVLDEHAVVARDALVAVGDEGELEVGSETALRAGLGGPGEVRVGRVGRDTWSNEWHEALRVS